MVWGSEGRYDPAQMEVMALPLPSMSLVWEQLSAWGEIQCRELFNPELLHPGHCLGSSLGPWGLGVPRSLCEFWFAESQKPMWIWVLRNFYSGFAL